MLDIGGWEFLVVAFVLLMVVGPKELPKMLRGFTRAMRQIRSMASEFTRGMEDLASDSELGDLKNSISDVKSGNLDRIADKIDPGGELKESVSDIKSNGDFDDAIEELSNIKNIGGDAGQQMVSATAPVKTQPKAPKAKSAKKKKS
jgi:sec-independent protein translocase protein TatB